MKIAYVTTYDASDVRKWSGLGHYIARALEQAGFALQRISGLCRAMTFPFRVRQILQQRFLSTQYTWEREPAVLRSFARQVDAALRRLDPDIVFSPGTLPIAESRTDKPIAFWTDATFDGIVGFYPGSAKMCARCRRDGHNAEQKALSRCRLALYASDWAAQSALEHYDVDARKVKVVPFGANLECHRTRREIEALVARRGFESCRLLFCGADWDRKGGDLTLAVARALQEAGLPTELHIVGCYPPYEVPAYVKVHGFVSKAASAGRQLLDQLFARSHFLVVPSKAECFGVVFAEASSFGVPSLSRRVGGIPTAVREGCNGRLFAPEAGPEEYGAFIQSLFVAPDLYRRLALRSFDEYQERLSWSAAGQAAARLLREFCT